MKTTLAVYANADDALLVWSVDELDDHCGGFAIQRKRGRSRVPTWLDNYAPPGRKAHQRGLHQRSDTRPFRRFSWTDHEVGAGDAVRYRVVPVVSGKPVEALASEWSERRTLGAANGPYRAYFNRGFVISQFMSRYLDQHYPALTRGVALEQFVKDIRSDTEDLLRGFLSGELRTALLALLAEVAAGDEHVYAALFELNDAELQRALEAVGARAHVVLANGSITAAKGEGSAQARTRDQNAAARKRLTDAGVDVRDRFISPGGLGHNKFLVVTSAAGEPRRVWTGSTNWSTTGLCTQLNNALQVDDRDVAQAYLA
jgi:phospholipase D-like protein